MTIRSKPFGTLIGTFGKGVTGSRTINFAPSGSSNCSDDCPLKGKSCYAETTEKRKGTITVNLLKKAQSPDQYAAELADNAHLISNAPWIRFSAFGSIPMVVSEAWIKSMRRVAEALPKGRVHFPVETMFKAQLVRSLGLLPRLSAATSEDVMVKALSAGYVTSLVVDCGKKVIGKNKRKIAEPAFDKARELNAKGIKTKVCPAIPGNAKCGACTMCGNETIKVIIYPLHP